MILVGALLLDLGIGEPSNFCHPVAWLGAALGRAFRAAPRQGRVTPFLSGAAIVGAAAGATVSLLLWATPAMASLGWLGVAAQIWLLKCSFSLRGLFSAARAVQRALAAGDLKRARVEVGLHLVSRPTSGLGAAEVASAAIESVAENLTDGFVAPVLFYLVLGLPAAWAYRVVNGAARRAGARGGRPGGRRRAPGAPDRASGPLADGQPQRRMDDRRDGRRSRRRPREAWRLPAR